MSTPSLAARGLRAGYPGHRDVLCGVDLEVSRGSTLALLGANGCGKSTLLSCLSGSLEPGAGQVHVDGAPLRFTRSALNRHRTHVQLVLQDPDDQLFSADVEADISFGPLNLGLEQDEVRLRVDQVLEALEISDLRHRPVHHLSFGNRKRVALAGALAMRPAVLLLDEPTAGLDPSGTAALLATLTHLIETGTTVLFSTHDVALAWRWADEVAVLDLGTVRQGTPSALLTDADLMSRAGLEVPWQARVLRAAGVRTIEEPRPRDAEAVAHRLQTPHRSPTISQEN